MNSTQQEQVTEKNWQFVKSFQINVNRIEWESEHLDGYLYIDQLGFTHIEVWQDANYFVGGSIEVKDLTLKAKIDCVYFEPGLLYQTLLADQIISPVQHFVGFIECRLNEQVNQPLQQYPDKIKISKKEIKDYMVLEIEHCLEPSGEINSTQLAENTAAYFGIYEGERYSIPEEIFDWAVEVVLDLEESTQ